VKIYLQEKIGNPDLFTGRKKELTYFLKWMNRSKRYIAKSTAILSRRKTGKSALMQRLYNITFHNNDGVIPFYFEIKEHKQWLGDFALDFFKAFLLQYFAFKTRHAEYIDLDELSLEQATEIAGSLNLDYLVQLINNAKPLVRDEKSARLWNLIRDMPRRLAYRYDEPIVQMIDEFQYINRFIYRDKACTDCLDALAGSYLHTIEYTHSPMLISGSWVGWLMQDLQTLLPGRVNYYSMHHLPENEAIEMIYRYSQIEKVPVTEETAYLIANLTEGNPFYVSGLFQSQYHDKDFTSESCILKTLDFEMFDIGGNIRGTWLEYIDSAFPRINERYAKDIVLYLSKHRDSLITRNKLKKALNLNMPDIELDKKLKALFQSDIIEKGYPQIYKGVQDNIFDKIFRHEYGKDIDEFFVETIHDEYKILFEELHKKYKSLRGEHNHYKGMYAEFMLIQHLRVTAHRNNKQYQTMMENLLDGFQFVEYKSVLGYHSPPLHEPAFQIDVFARAKPDQISLIGEVKHRQTTKFSLKETKQFQENAVKLSDMEQIETYQLFIFSSAGFYDDVLPYFRENDIAWSDDARWLEQLA